MNDYQNWSRTGEQFKDAVTDALQSGDFGELNRLVSQTVTNTLDEVGIHITLGGNVPPRSDTGTSGGYSGDSRSQTEIPLWQQAQEAPYRNQQQAWQEMQQQRRQEQQLRQQQEMQRRQEQQMRQQQEIQRRQEMQQQRRQQEAQRRQEQQMQRQTPLKTGPGTALAPVRIKKVGSVSNILYQVFGGIGLGISGIVAFVRLIMLAAGATTLTGWMINLVILTLFSGMIRVGIGQRRRLKRAERYAALCGTRMFAATSDLARDTGKNERYVTKDLQKMLRLGMFPEGHLDEGNTCLMLNDQVYRQYLDAENGRRQREALAQKEAAPAPEASSTANAANEQEAELNAMVAEGMEYIRKLRDLNDRIPGDIISAKLFRLEGLLKEIFDRVKEHPDQMHRMHRLMDYYLPTTLKLVESYAEFDQVSTPGNDIKKAKAEIENTLDAINQAFTELLNNLFQSAVFDATTDAQVLKTMLAREGLTREMEFVNHKN